MSGPPDTKPGGFDPNFITSMLPDGTLLQFPKGTPPDVVDRVFKEQLGNWMQAQKAQASQPKPPEVGTAKAFGIGGTQGLTFNLGDEIAAGIGATIGRPGGGDIAGETWGDRYDNALTEARGVQNAAKEQHPFAYGSGEFAGAAIPAVIAPEMYGSNWIASAPNMASSMGRAALASGTAGLIQGFGAGEGGAKERATAAAIGGTTAAAIGAAAQPVARAVGAAFTGRRPNPAVPTNAQLGQAGNAAYEMADNAGVVIAPQAMRNLADDIDNIMGNAAFDQDLHPQIAAAIRRLRQAGDSGNNYTLRGLDVLRQIAGDAADSPRRGERRLGTMLIDRIDDMIDGLGPQDLVQGDADIAVPALQTARQIWSSLRKSELVDELTYAAELQANSTNSGGNMQNILRQKLRTLLTNRSLGRGFNAEERAALEGIVNGTITQNTLRTLGRLAPSSNSWLGVISTLAGGPAGLAVPAVGAAAKAGATRSTQNAIDEFSEMVRRGAGLVVPQAPQPPDQGAAMARALMGPQAGATGLGSYYANELLRPTGGPR